LDNSTGKAEIADEMIARLQDKSRSDLERSGLLVGLSALTERSEVRDAVQELYGKPETRLKALEAMWRSLNPDFAEYFPEHLDDTNKEIRRVALRGIGAQGLTSELAKVRALLKDEDLREDALFAYALAIPGKDSPAFLRSLLKKIETEAGGFSEEEEEIVRTALDERLRAAGKPPIFQQ
jgi:HEAT repeat protein